VCISEQSQFDDVTDCIYDVAAAVPVHVDMNPPMAQQAEQFTTDHLTMADGIINRLKQTSPVVIQLIRRLREDITANDRTTIQHQLRHHYEAALYQGGIPPGMVPGLASMLARSTVSDIQMVLARHGDSIVVYFLCKTMKGIYKLGQMITSGFMHAVFTVVIQTAESHTTVDVYVRADEYNLRLLCLMYPQQKGQSLFRHTHLSSDTCVSPHHNTNVSHSSDTHT